MNTVKPKWIYGAKPCKSILVYVLT